MPKKGKMNRIFAIFPGENRQKMLNFGSICRFLTRKNRLFQILKTVPECCYCQLSSDVKIFSKFPTLFSKISKTWERMVLYPWYRAKLHVFPLNLLWKLKNTSAPIGLSSTAVGEACLKDAMVATHFTTLITGEIVHFTPG